MEETVMEAEWRRECSMRPKEAGAAEMRAHHGSGVRAYARAAEAGGHYRGIADMAGLVAGSTRSRITRCRPSRQRRFYCSQCRLKWTKCLP
jgi:putative component of toxin-antitoxin plasmid stabilization module